MVRRRRVGVKIKMKKNWHHVLEENEKEIISKKISKTLKERGIIPPSREGKVPWNKGKKCNPPSEQHRKKLSEGVKKAYDKKGRITPHRILLRTSKKYLDWRRSVFERDNYTCQGCGAKSGNGKRQPLNAHHIIPVSIDESMIFEKDNGVTLCIECHQETHKRLKEEMEVTPAWG